MAPRTGADRFDQQGQGFGADAVQLGQLEKGSRRAAAAKLVIPAAAKARKAGRPSCAGKSESAEGALRRALSLASWVSSASGTGRSRGKRMVALTNWCGALLLANTVSIASVAG